VADDWLAAGRYDLVVANDVLPAKITLQPLYDPTNARVKA
jgi:4-methylaminobutanoate oxidase (formaldehyde-forming)